MLSLKTPPFKDHLTGNRLGEITSNNICHCTESCMLSFLTSMRPAPPRSAVF